MLEFMQGTVKSLNADSFILDLGKIGVNIFSSQKTINGFKAGDDVVIFTSLIVKEDGIQLYGFATKEERNMFLLLNSVSGIGPKAAMAVLSAFLPGELAMVIMREDLESLTNVKGVGKKNAGRLVLELKDKIKRKTGSMEVPVVQISGKDRISNELSEAYSALIVLGYSEKDVKNTVPGIYKQDMTVEEILKEALKIM